MPELAKLSGNYWVEVSGWGLDASFFVEKTDLYWGQGGDKKVCLRHSVLEGAILFVRLLSLEEVGSTLPVAYRVEEMKAMGSNGLSEMTLQQLHPRKKVPLSGELASYALDNVRRKSTCEPNENSEQMETEEVLQ